MTARTLGALHRAHLDGLRAHPPVIDAQGLRLGDTYIMFRAEAELMSRHAEQLIGGRPGADVLEVGLGLGVFAEQLAAFAPGSYHVVEPHPGIVDVVAPRVRSAMACPVTVSQQPWQLLDLPPGSLDAIMYDTWPPDGYADQDFAAFVEHVALPALRPCGRLSFFHSGTEMSPARAEVLDHFFARWATIPYQLPADQVPTAWSKPTNHFLVPVAEKGAR